MSENAIKGKSVNSIRADKLAEIELNESGFNELPHSRTADANEILADHANDEALSVEDALRLERQNRLERDFNVKDPVHNEAMALALKVALER